QQSLEMAQVLISAPFLTELDGGSLELAVVLLQFAFESGKESEGVGSGAGESGNDPVVEEPPHFARIALHYRVLESDLTVTGHRDMVVPTHRQDCRAADNGPPASFA